jgi:hypothetical protein
MALTEIITLIATIVVAGWFSAFITQAIKQVKWPSSLKLLLSGIVAGLVALAASWLSGDLLGFVTLWGTGGLTAQEVIVYFSGVFASAATWYRFYFKDATWAENLALWPSEIKDS